MYSSLIDLSSLLKEYLKIKIDGVEVGWNYIQES